MEKWFHVWNLQEKNPLFWISNHSINTSVFKFLYLHFSTFVLKTWYFLPKLSIFRYMYMYSLSQYIYRHVYLPLFIHKTTENIALALFTHLYIFRFFSVWKGSMISRITCNQRGFQSNPCPRLTDCLFVPPYLLSVTWEL